MSPAQYIMEHHKRQSLDWTTLNPKTLNKTTLNSRQQ